MLYTKTNIDSVTQNQCYLSHRSCDTEFLCTDEALQHDSHSHIDIVFIDIIS